MKRQLRFALIAAALLVLLASASTVFAFHESRITGLTCNFQSGVVTVYGTYFGAGGTGSTIGADIWVGGVFAGQVNRPGPSTGRSSRTLPLPNDSPPPQPMNGDNPQSTIAGNIFTMAFSTDSISTIRCSGSAV
jgi:hypothetical protein